MRLIAGPVGVLGVLAASCAQRETAATISTDQRLLDGTDADVSAPAVSAKHAA